MEGRTKEGNKEKKEPLHTKNERFEGQNNLHEVRFNPVRVLLVSQFLVGVLPIERCFCMEGSVCNNVDVPRVLLSRHGRSRGFR